MSSRRTTARGVDRSRLWYGCLRFVEAKWEAVGITPRGIDRENVEMLHRTHMGVDNDYVNTLLHAPRTGLSDGWGGSMIATELSDVMFGTPKPVMSEVNLGVLKDRPSEDRHARAQSVALRRDLSRLLKIQSCSSSARSYGANGINVVGLCCTGNEMLMRLRRADGGQPPDAGAVLVTGALEAMVVDYQCIMPSIVDVAKCYHTKIISTADKAKFTGATHVSFEPEHGAETAKQIVRMAVEALPGSQPRPSSHSRKARQDDGRLLGGSHSRCPRRNAKAARRRNRGRHDSRGGCCCRVQQPEATALDLEHIELTRRLIENDILVLVTGCAAVANGKVGQMVPEAAAMAGPGLRSVCEALGIPPVLHVGSCVDNSRIMVLVAALADYLGVDIDQLPVAGAAPEWYSEKAVAIGAYVVASGITTVRVSSHRCSEALTWSTCWRNGLDGVVGAKFVVEPDPAKAALFIRRHIEAKRQGLGLPFIESTDMAIDDGERPVAVPVVVGSKA